MIRRIDARGSTAAEFAVSMSVFLVLVLAVIDIGRLYADQHALDYSVEKAVRYAVVNSTASTTTITSQFTNAITPAVGASRAAGATVSVTFSPSEAVGSTVTVSATLAWSALSAIDDLVALTLTSSQTLTIVH
jgi:Flp pilus assembly protein TadG